MDELAHAAGLDPLEFRLRNLDDPRLRAVLEDAAAKFGWGKSKPAEGPRLRHRLRHRKGGIRGHLRRSRGGQGHADRSRSSAPSPRSSAGRSSTPTISRTRWRGPRQGLGGALFEAIRFANGKITTPVSRATLFLVSATSRRSRSCSATARTCPRPAAARPRSSRIAPAVANAIFSATGIRLRSMPLVPEGVVKSLAARGR